MRILLAIVFALALIGFAAYGSPPVEKVATADQSVAKSTNSGTIQLTAEIEVAPQIASHFADQLQFHWIPTPKAEPFECLHVNKREIRCTSLRLQTDSGQAFYDQGFARQWATLKL